MKRLCLLFCSLCLAGCFGFGRKIENPVPGPESLPSVSDPTSWLSYVAYAATTLGAVGFIVGLIMLSQSPKRAGQVIVCAISAIVGGQILLFIGLWLVWVSAVILLLGLAAVSMRHHKKIREYLDGPDNGTDRFDNKDTEVIHNDHSAGE